MKNISRFQGILLAILLLSAIAGVAVFALSRDEGVSVKEGGTGGPVALWGTFDALVMNELLQEIRRTQDGFEVLYTQIPEEDFDRQVIEAIASASGPDVILAPHAFLGRFDDKIIRIPFESIPERTYRDTYIDGAELFVSNEGIAAMPFAVDPLIMYWNRDLIASAGLSRPPATWEEFRSVVSRLTQKDANGGLRKSGVAFGAFDNVLHAKDIVATLIMQAGSPLTLNTGSGYTSVLNRGSEAVDAPATAALTFFTEFADPLKPTYSWSRALPRDQERFLSGDLALYIGSASELPTIRQRNPNLNFDIAPVPQSSESTRPRVFGDIYGIMVLQTAKNVAGGFVVMQTMANQNTALLLSDAVVLPPVHRNLLSVTQTDSYKPIFYRAALITQGWYDPHPRETDEIFRTMIQSVTNGQARIGGAIRTAHVSLEELLE